MHWSEWTHGSLKFAGHSSAGVATTISIPSLHLCFDVAQGTQRLMTCKDFLITHGHLDHAAGIPYMVSQKRMQKHKPPRIFLPEKLVEPMDKVLSLWQEIEAHDYEYQLIPVRLGTSYELRTGLSFEAFKTHHSIPCNGYTIYKEQKKLKEEFIGKSRDELLSFKSQGINIEGVLKHPLVSFTGDTTIDFLHSSPQVKESKILFMEVSFVDDARTALETKEWGHTHLDDIVELLPQLNCEKIVFIHLSRRYPNEYAWQKICEKISSTERERIVLWSHPPSFS